MKLEYVGKIRITENEGGYCSPSIVIAGRDLGYDLEEALKEYQELSEGGYFTGSTSPPEIYKIIIEPAKQEGLL